MKVDLIKEEIISKYNILADKTKIKTGKKDYLYTWGLQYRPNNVFEGCLNESGRIKRKNDVIKIENNQIKTVKKSFFSTWKRSLTKINKMLDNMIANYGNTNIVKPKYKSALCFPKDSLNDYIR